MTQVKIAATQMACGWDIEENLARAEELVRTAAGQGANVVLLQELFATPYFCPDQKQEHFALAQPAEGNAMIARFAALAAELEVVLPVSFFERANNAYFNSLAMVDADGAMLGLYRKSHIPQGPGYQEKFYFNPGDTGFRVWETRFGAIGAGICWDQWFPECARAMALQGADILLYPTAIGSEPDNPDLDSCGHWQRTMQGHAAANMVVLAASNRVGVEDNDSATMTFYGSSFIAGPTGDFFRSRRYPCEAGRVGFFP
jgi:N-carbamoylputrescine amidase